MAAAERSARECKVCRMRFATPKIEESRARRFCVLPPRNPVWMRGSLARLPGAAASASLPLYGIGMSRRVVVSRGDQPLARFAAWGRAGDPRALCRRPLPAARRRSTARLRRHCSAWELLSSLASRCVGAAARRSLVFRGFSLNAPRRRPPPTRRVRAAHAARAHPRRPCRGGGRQSRTSRLARDLLETAKACCEADRRRLRRRRAQQN